MDQLQLFNGQVLLFVKIIVKCVHIILLDMRLRLYVLQQGIDFHPKYGWFKHVSGLRIVFRFSFMSTIADSFKVV